MKDLLSKINQKNVFLVDGIGALLSAFSLAVTLPFFWEWIKMPMDKLYLLAAIAGLFSFYSLSCFFTKPQNKAWLGAIIFANLSYCVLTTYYMIIFSGEIKPLGFTYFVVEILIILGLVNIEYRIFKTLRSNESLQASLSAKI